MQITKLFACALTCGLVVCTSLGAEEAPGAAAETKASLHATIETAKGDIRLELFPDKAPVTVASFVNLIERGFYNGLTFHRVDPRFVVQGGDPNGNGTGGPGYTFENEPNEDLKHHGEGVLAMAHRGPDTNGSQFYITFRAAPHLDGGFTIFGKVASGMDVAKAITRGDKMVRVTVEGDSSALKEKMKERIANWNAILDKR